MNIAICDDDKTFLAHAKELVTKILFRVNDEFDIDTFQSGLALLEESEKYSILILDIDMPEINGLKLAEKIREKDEDVQIIFLTSIFQFVFESFKVNPFRYVMKTSISDQLPEALISCYEKINLKNNQIFNFYYKGTNYALRLSDIFYFAYIGRKVTVVTAKEEYSFYGKINEIETQLAGFFFVRIHSGFLVNLNRISSISAGEVTMADGKMLPVSRQRYAKLKEAYLIYLRKEVDL